MHKVLATNKLTCPYCKQCSEHSAQDYISQIHGHFSSAIESTDCEHCDQNFLIRKVNDDIYIDSNFTEKNLYSV